MEGSRRDGQFLVSCHNFEGHKHELIFSLFIKSFKLFPKNALNCSKLIWFTYLACVGTSAHQGFWVYYLFFFRHKNNKLKTCLTWQLWKNNNATMFCYNIKFENETKGFRLKGKKSWNKRYLKVLQERKNKKTRRHYFSEVFSQLCLQIWVFLSFSTFKNYLN